MKPKCYAFNFLFSPVALKLVAWLTGLNKKSQPIGWDFLSVGGAGGIRTRVQTRKTYAFYMLILLLIFDYKPETNTQLIA